jgi:transcription-repair coupling factor (superfamily II helicase)
MHDLEIRGAGNILGVNQSGHIDAVGYEMYLQLLEKAIRELKGEEIYDVDPEIKLGIEAYIPDEYILDTSQKLIFYKRLASSISEEDIDDIKGEFIDRYGPLPNTLNNLLYIIIIKILLKRLYAKEISYERSKILIYFNDISKLNREKLFNLLKKNKRDIILTKDYKLIIDLREKEYILPKIIDILKEIS